MGCSPSDSKVFTRREKTFHILHFNDVYNLTEKEKEPVGGAARFITAMQQFDNLEPMVLFSGDIYSPSKLSQTMRGMHMVPFLQKAKLTAACVGNHDLDFGIDRFKELKKETEFPWLLTNVFAPGTKNPIGHATDHLIVHHKGIKIGMIGVAEEEWLTSIISLNKEDYEFQDFINTSKQWVDILREKGWEMIIALTHMGLPNDKLLAQKVDGIDLILGGHDHLSSYLHINNTVIWKSSSDFREFSLIKVRVNCSDGALAIEPEKNIVSFHKRLIMTHQKVLVTKEYDPDPELQSIINSYTEEVMKELEKPAGFLAVELDSRFNQIRCKETNTSNFVADVVNLWNKSDITLINSGSLRADEMIPKGVLKWKNLDDLFPIISPWVVLNVKGEALLKLLENGLSGVPKLEGKFPCVSGIKLKYDSSKPSMRRIHEVEINGQPLDPEKYYSWTTNIFLFKGKEGYDEFTKCKVLVDSENAVSINSCLHSFFTRLNKNTQQRTLVDDSKIEEILKMFNNPESECAYEDERGQTLGAGLYKLYPKVDGRITDISSWE